MTDTPFELRSSRDGDTVFVEIVGEIDMATAPELERILSWIDGATRVVVDLSEVSFLDSTALNALIRCQRRLKAQEITFRLVSPADRIVRKVFEITHLDEPLNVVSSVEEALA